MKKGKEIKTLHRNMLLPVSFPCTEEVLPGSDKERPVVQDPIERMNESIDSDESEYPVVVEIYSPNVLQVEPEPLLPSVETQNRDCFNNVNVSPQGTMSPSVDTQEQQLEFGGNTMYPSEEAPQQHVNIEANLMSPRGEESQSPSGEESGFLSGKGGSGEEQPVRRSSRTRNLPDRYGLAYSHGIQVTNLLPEWRDRLSILALLMELFPDNKNQILSAMIFVITGRDAGCFG